MPGARLVSTLAPRRGKKGVVQVAENQRPSGFVGLCRTLEFKKNVVLAYGHQPPRATVGHYGASMGTRGRRGMNEELRMQNEELLGLRVNPT